MKRFLLTMMVGLFAVSCENAFVEEAQFIPVAGKWAKVGEDGLVSRYIEFENGLYREYNARPLVVYTDGTLWGCSDTYFECVIQQQYSIIDGLLIVEGRNNSNISLTSPTTLKINNIHYDKVTSFNDEYYRQIDVEDQITIDYSTESVAIPCEISNADNDVEIDIECNANWVKSVTYQRGELLVRCSQNNLALKRTAVVTLSYAGAKTKTISIVQARNIVSPDNAILYTTSDNKMITTITSSAFDVAIRSHTYEDGVGVIAFDGPITKIVGGAFFYSTSLTSITIPDSVTTIGSSAFENCSSLTSITIPDSVTSIGSSAFRSCSLLTSITIPDSVTSIEYYAFAYCSSLTSITIGNGVTTIGESAFRSCSSLTSITIPDSVTSIGDCAFEDCSSLTSVTIGNGVTTIGSSVFYYCSSLTSVTIPDSVTTIGNFAFAYCSSLTSFYGKFASSDNRCLIIDGVLTTFAPAGLTSYTIPDSVTTIGESAFRSCSSLTSITIGNGVTSIGDGAFRGCSSLTSITIGNGVTSIGDGAFRGCSSLTSVYCKPTTPPSIEFYSFYNNASGLKIYVPQASVDKYKSADGWSRYASAIVGYDF